MPVPGSDPRYRFLARFGATILSGGIAAIPMALYHYQAELGLVPQEVWFVGYILAHRWTADLPYPSLRRMSRRTGVSTQMLHRYKQSLIEKGYLQTIPRHRPSGGRTSNYYDFSSLFHTLEHFLARDRRDGQWQPSADETAEETLDDQEQDGFDPEHEPRGVPSSQRPQVIPLPPRMDGGRQHTLIGGQSAPISGDDRSGEPPALPPDGEGPARHNAPLKKTPFVQTHQGDPFLQDAYGSHRASGREGRETSGTTERALQAAPEPEGPGSAEGEWREILERLRSEVSEASLSAWLLPAAPSWAADGHLRLVCQSTFHLQHVERRFRTAIERAAGVPVEIALG